MKISNYQHITDKTARFRGIGFFAIFWLIFLFSCNDEIPNKFETEKNLISISDYLIQNKEQFSDFIELMEASSLEDALRAYNPNGQQYTLFLPDNDAFDLFFQENNQYSSISDLKADTEFLNHLTRYHIVNKAIPTNNFPLGALPDSTLSGEYLIIAYIQDADSTYFKVDNLAFVKNQNLEMTNGYIHVIDHVLKPITFSGYDWLKANTNYQIFTSLLETTGLNDTLSVENINVGGRTVKNKYTLLVEADSIYNKAGIFSVDDLKAKYSAGSNDFKNHENSLHQFAAYHILEGSNFLADLTDGASNYNTYASLPVQISTGLEIKVNIGVANFDSIFHAQDSIYEYINYLNILVNESNVQTQNGPIHFLNRVMELFKPGRVRRDFAFYEEPLIGELKGTNKEYIFTRPERFTVLQWSGAENLIYNGNDKKAWANDYIEISGNFSLKYRIPKILAGKYGVQIRVDSGDRDNATIQLFIDGKKIGTNLNLTTGGTSSSPFRLKNMGIIEFNRYEEHTVEVKTLIPGRFAWDIIRFENNLKTYGENRQ